MRRCLPLIAGLLLLAACKPPTTTPQAHKSAAPLASAPAPAGSVAVAAASGPLARLQAPKDATRVAGVLTMEAAYVLASGQGKLIANNGGNVVSMGGGSILANNGGNFTGAGDGSPIAPAALGDPSTLISDNGLGLIDQTRLISDNGLGLISDNGLGIVANNGGGYGLLAEAAPPPGTLLPAAGMLVGVASLSSGELLPIGTDAAGKPVYAALSDTAGRYTLYLPKDVAGNVRVVALAPGANDPRLQYGLVFAPASAGGAQELGEATALASAFLRIQMTRFLELYLATPADQLAARFKRSEVPDALVPALSGIFGDMQAAAAKANYKDLPLARRRRGLQRCADAILATAKLDAFRVNTNLADWHGPDEPALAAMAGLIGKMNEHTAAILKADPHHFEQKPFIVSVNRQRQAAGLAPLAIARPDDLAVLALGEYFAGTDPAELRKLEEVLVDIGLPTTERQHLSAAASGIYQGMLGSLLGDDDTRNRLLDQLPTVFGEAGPAKPPAPGGVGAPVPPAPTPEGPATVTTIAGNGKGGGKDGPALTASLADPRALVLQEGPTGVTLYLSDGNAIRRLAQGADGGFTLDTIAGGATSGFKDGPGAQALFKTPVGLALDGKGGLYVADFDGNRVRRVALDDPAFTVTTVAGNGSPGTTNGPGATAAFELPVGVAYQAGKLYVINQLHPRLRQIDLETAGFPVTNVNDGPGGDMAGPVASSSFDNTVSIATTANGWILLGTVSRIWQIQDGFQRTLVGTSYAGGRDAFWMDARMGYIYAMATDAAGNVFAADSDNGRIFRVWPSGDVQTLAGSAGLGTDEHGYPAPGYVDGAGKDARFDHPQGLAIDAKGRLYVADRNNRRIRLITR